MPWQQTRCGSLWPGQLCCQLQRAQTLMSWNRSVGCMTPAPWVAARRACCSFTL